jgi:hypothetical protein
MTGGGQSKNDCPLLIFRSPNIRLCLPCWMLPGRKADRRLHPFDLDHDRCGRENSATMSITPQELQKLFDERKPTEELVNFCFAEYLQDFNKNNAI